MGETEQAGQENPNNGVWGYHRSSSWMAELGGGAGSSSRVPGTVVGILQPWSHGVCISSQQGGETEALTSHFSQVTYMTRKNWDSSLTLRPVLFPWQPTSYLNSHLLPCWHSELHTSSMKLAWSRCFCIIPEDFFNLLRHPQRRSGDDQGWLIKMPSTDFAKKQ